MRLRRGGSSFFLGRAAAVLFAQAVTARRLLARFLAAQLVARLVTLELTAAPQLVVRHAVALRAVRALATFDRALLRFGRLLRRFGHRTSLLRVRNGELYYTPRQSQPHGRRALCREPLPPLRGAAQVRAHRALDLLALPSFAREVPAPAGPALHALPARRAHHRAPRPARAHARR